VIATAELHEAAQREGLRFDQAEEDYVILCALSGLASETLREWNRQAWKNQLTPMSMKGPTV
jgi:hypothetical protein